MWWLGLGWYEVYNLLGAIVFGSTWAVAEGEVGGARDVDTYILIANTSELDGVARVTLLFENGDQVSRRFAVGAHSRLNVDARREFVASAGRRFGAIVASEGTSPAALVVERAMYSSIPGQPWAAGTDNLGTRLR